MTLLRTLSGNRGCPCAEAGATRAAVLLTVVLLQACASAHLEVQPPPAFDLSGTWTLVKDQSDEPPSHRHLRARGGMLAFVTRDFPVMRASELRIEQNRDSMGIRFDTGDYRDVTWGTRHRGLWKVKAGWDEGQLIILSKADDADARQTLVLSADGHRLSVETRVDSGGEHVLVTRVFSRS